LVWEVPLKSFLKNARLCPSPFLSAFSSFVRLIIFGGFSRSVYRHVSTVYTGFGAVALTLILATGASPLGARAQNSVFKIPPVKVPLDVKGQPITITASAILTVSSKERNQLTLNLELTADLSDLQRNLTDLLRTEMNKDDRCGERMTIENATLVPADPASLAMIQLHYERWVCAKVLGKQVNKKLLDGDAQVQIKLTPAIAGDGTGLQLIPELAQIQADGTLGELLRSGALGEAIRKKIQSAMLSALQKGTNLGAALPPAIQGYITIRNAKFKDAGDGRLLVLLGGEARISQEQVQLLSKQMKERPAH
jgi:hypothetical protein